MSHSTDLSTVRTVAAHVLRHLARAQSRGRGVRLDELASDIGVEREDVRHAVSSLHHEGHVDAKRMRLTMSGFALAASMREYRLRDPLDVRYAHITESGFPPPVREVSTTTPRLALIAS